MLVKQYHVVVYGTPIDVKIGATATSTLNHHRMIWTGRPSLEDFEQMVADACALWNWSSAVVVGIYPMKGYWLWNSPDGVTADGEPFIPRGCPPWLMSAAKAAKADNDRDTAKAKAFIARVKGWFKRSKDEKYEDKNYD